MKPINLSFLPGFIIKCLFLSVFVGSVPAFIFAQDPLLKTVEALKFQVVAIKTTFADGSEEKGFSFITGEKDGQLFLATAAHVIRGNDLSKTPKLIKARFINDLNWLDAKFIRHWDQDDLALLEIKKPSSLKWQSKCADFSAHKLQKVRFIGKNGNEPQWFYPGTGEIFDISNNVISFTIASITPGTSGAPLIGSKGIVGMVVKDENGSSTALKMYRIREVLSNGGQYPYFNLQPITALPEPKPGPYGGAPLSDPFANDLVLIKGGTFKMGCTAEQGLDCDTDENPAYEIQIKDFYLSKFEVTQSQWQAIMGVDSKKNFNCSQCPVENISWDEVNQFIRKLNSTTNKKYRLPTEAEWEFAARGGVSTSRYKYAGSNNADEVSWHGSNAEAKPHPVGTKKANELGLFDMSGNVWEWCSDLYGPYVQNNTQVKASTATGGIRNFRGGGWNSNPKSCRVSSRSKSGTTFRFNYLGLRLAQ